MANSLLPNRQADEEIGAVHIGILFGEHVGVVGVEAQLLVTVEDGTLVVEDVIDTLAGGEKFNLFATSMGAPVASAYCAKHPERVNKLIFYAPAGMDTFKPPFYMYLSACPLIGDFIFANWGEKVLFKNVTREMKHVNIDPYLEKLAESFRYKGFSRCTLSSLRNTILKTKKSTSFLAEAAKKNIPTLCLWGNADITMPFYMSKRFRKIMPEAEFQFSHPDLRKN